MDWFPHTQYLENKLLHIRNNLSRCPKATWGLSYANLVTIYKYAILPTITYAAEAWHSSISKRAKNKLQQIQRSFLLFLTKAYRTVSLEALSAIARILPIDQALNLHKDKRAITRGQPTNAVIAQLKRIETPTKMRGAHPIDSYIQVELTGTEGTAETSIYTDGSETEHHVGADMVAVKNSREISIGTQLLNIACTVFQAELRGIGMAVDWIRKQWIKSYSYAINADSKATLLAIANKQATHPVAVDIRRKTIDLRTVTSITFHWIRGHTCLEGNERADYLARTIASYNTTIIYDALPVSRRKQLLEEYYTKIWDASYVNSAKASHTKSLIPSIIHRLAHPLWPNHFLTQLLTNHGCFRSYLHKMKKLLTPLVLVLKNPNKRRNISC